MMAQPRVKSLSMTDYEFIIKPSGRLSALRVKELWEYRELFYFLIWRDVKVRYKQTVLGVAWAILRPVISMLVFTFVFNRLAGFTSEGIPYQLFTLSGVLAWNFFAEGLTGSSQSLIASANLLTKVYFPRLIIPTAAVLRGFVDFGIGLLIFAGSLAYFHFPPTSQLALFPLVMLWEVIATLGVGLWFTAIGVKYRDIAHVLPFVVQVLFWITPVGYSSARIPKAWEYIYWLNPMTGVVEGFRLTLLGSAHLPPRLFWMSVTLSFVIFFTGLLNFRRMEKEFVDVI